jgi:TetR/AcrR family transcriptional regulator
MFSKFLNLKIEKQEKILQATIREFADKGFERASTNEIVKEAEISKGILFHYFQNKKNLFLFAFDYFVDLCMDEYYKKVDLEETDFFEKLRQISSFKLELVHKYPSIFKFFEVAIGEECTEVKSEIEKRKKKLTESHYSKVFNNIDMSKFADGVDVSRAINAIMWTFEGLGTSELQKAKASETKRLDYEKVFGEMDIYIDMFKSCFYK